MTKFARPLRRLALATAQRAQRKAERHAIGPLNRLRLAERTRKRYTTAYSRFTTFLVGHGSAPSTLDEVDTATSAFIESCWSEGDPKLWCSDLLAALHFYLPACRRQLHGSWGLIRAWDRAELPARACPITPEILLGIAGCLAEAGFWRDAALALVGYHLLLRTGELLTLQRQDLIFSAQGGVRLVRLRETKGQKLRGGHDQVIVEDPVIGRLLALLAHGLEPGDFLHQSQPQYWRFRWAQAVKRLGLSDLNVKPYSLRRGGCTHFFRLHGNYDRTIERGRWTQVTTARRYLDEATSTLSDLLLADDVRALLARLGTFLRGFVGKYVTDAELQRSALFSGSPGTRALRVRFTTKRGQLAPRTAGRPSSGLGTTPKSHIVPAPPLGPISDAPPKRSVLAQGVARGVKRLRLASFGE